MNIEYRADAEPREGDIFCLFIHGRSDLVLLQWSGAEFSLPRSLPAAAELMSFCGSSGPEDGGSCAIWSAFLPAHADFPRHSVPIREDGSYDPRYGGEPGTLMTVKIRESHGLLSGEDFQAVSRASQIAHWRRRTRFCGVCSGSLDAPSGELAMCCPSCGERYYPSISPAVIVRIQKGGQILMVKNAHRPSSFYGLVAGFVEAGESFEEAVIREVREETSLEVTNISYAMNQSWPFPNSHMIAFTADYAGGELKIQESELSEARWFGVHDIPPMPPRLSVARQLVEAFIEEQRAETSPAGIRA